MIDTKLIILEGLPGTGKTTNSFYLLSQLERNGVVARWIHENARPDPTSYFNEACLSYEELEQFIFVTQRINHECKKQQISIGGVMSKSNQIILFLVSSVFSILIIRDSIKTMLKANIGKKNEKKVNPKPSIINRILLIYTIKYTKKYSGLCRIMISINCIYSSLIILFFSFIIMSTYNTIFQDIARFILIFKGFILDGPIMVFSLAASKHGERGGVKWRFEK